MMGLPVQIAVGDQWEIYSEIKRAWAPAKVSAIEGGVAVFQYRDFPEACSVEVATIPFAKRMLRRMTQAGN